MDKVDNEITLGERINKYRVTRGLSQLELSELLDVSRQSISKWETDVAVPELAKLVKMAEIFEISLDELVLGKEPENKEEKTKEKEEQPEATAPVKEKEPYSRIKNGMGFMFLGVGVLLSFLLLLLGGDMLSALIIFIPFGLSAFFCLRQFRHAALWCGASFFFMLAWYIYVGTGARWNAVFSPVVYTDAVNPWYTVISWALFVALAFFLGMTVFVYRGHKFEYSKRKHITLAVVTLAVCPTKFLWGLFYGIYCFEKFYEYGIYPKYSLIIQTIDYLIELAFLFTFAACLVPTFYWVLGLVKRKKENK